MDTRTGQILQLSQAPGFDPKDDDLSGDELRVKALEDVYEPGSVQKVLTFAALLDSGAIDPDTKITVPPTLPVGGEVVHDDVPHGTWHLTATGVIARSSNMGTVIASQEMENQELFDYLRAFGLGSTTGIGLAGETAGILSDPSTWLPIQRANIVFGQGVAVNAIQMAAAVNTIANDGVYVAPQLVAGTISSEGELERAAAPETRRVVSVRAARAVTRMMEAVTREGGTAPETGIAGYRVAGKTGTAQRVDPVNGGYQGRTISYVSFAPADEPRLLTYVVLDNAEGHFGSTGAGPVVKEILSMALKRYRIPPTGRDFPRQPLTW
jgi:cell division protein FtsI (penicillin-binding protein 3)